jgi:hypothetical protein
MHYRSYTTISKLVKSRIVIVIWDGDIQYSAVRAVRNLIFRGISSKLIQNPQIIIEKTENRQK